jgi:uncharacterized membrane protein
MRLRRLALGSVFALLLPRCNSYNGRAYGTDQTLPMSARRARRRLPLSHKRATVRLLISTAVGIATALWLTPRHIDWSLRALAGWDAASLTLAALAWVIILKADATATEQRASADDPGRSTVFLIAVVSSLVSLLAAALGLRLVKTLPGGEEAVWTVVAFGAVVLSWIVAHTSYTLRYASLYYGGHEANEAKQACVQFPGTDRPADIDFAYLAFTIGMCFQVSDVIVATSPMRREVLFHAALSFVYNTAIVALALNVAISMLS